jgi:hypothetical protein
VRWLFGRGGSAAPQAAALKRQRRGPSLPALRKPVGAPGAVGVAGAGEIASRRGLADGSVRRTLHHTAQRLGVRDRAQAIGWCVAQGLVSAADLQVIFAV